LFSYLSKVTAFLQVPYLNAKRSAIREVSYGATSIVIVAFHSIRGSTISNCSNYALTYANLTFNAERKTRLLSIITEKQNSTKPRNLFL